MRILNVVPWLAPRYGGPAVLVPQASVALAERGHEVEIIATNVDGHGVVDVPTGRRVEWNGAQATLHPLSSPAGYLTSWPMLADLRRRAQSFDIVHIHYLYRFHGLAAASVARAYGIPYVVQAHGSLNPWHRRQKRHAKTLYHALVEDRIIRGAAVMLATSAREASHIRALGYKVPLWSIPIGVDADELRVPAAPEHTAALGVAQDARAVTFLGRISAKKGVPLLVEAFQRVAATVRDAQLLIAGPDDEGIGRALMPTIASAGLANRISFIGTVDGPQKRALLQRSAVFVLPSADESFGIAVAEAMAVGCPVVVSPEVALEDVVRSAGAGLVVDREPRAIADSIAAILTDGPRALAMGEAGMRAVDDRFSWPMVAEQMESMYGAVLEATTRNGRRRDESAGRLPERSAAGPSFACPRCRGALRKAGDDFTCAACGWAGGSEEGVPILLVNEAHADHDELEHHGSHGHKSSQAAHFSRADDEEFEIRRPHATARLYRYLLDEKFRRAAKPLGPKIVGASVLTVCGGSGMDAEYFSGAGATVTSSDVSLGAALRARKRSDRFNLGIQSIVADVERLPFADQAVDLVAVHDGLHHLEDPQHGLAEMTRVAKRWVVITEPASASITRLAVRLGLAQETEEAGNRVVRFEPLELTSYLRSRGFETLRAERYAMYYPHRPGSLFGILSHPLLFPIVAGGWRIGNAIIGRFGNKMVVVAERTDARAE